MVIIGQHFGQEINLKSLRCRSISSLPPVTAATIDNTVLSQGLLCCQSAPSTHYAPIRQVCLPAHIALSLYDVTVTYLETVAHTTNLKYSDASKVTPPIKSFVSIYSRLKLASLLVESLFANKLQPSADCNGLKDIDITKEKFTYKLLFKF